MMEPFLLRALAAGILVALICGPLGCFVVWRRMAYFGDTLSHAALLGVALGIALDVAPTAGILLVCIAVALLLFAQERQRRLAGDTLLGILSHTTLALGLVVLSLMETVRVDLLGYLFGDVLAVGDGDLLVIGAGSGVALALLTLLWRPLLAVTVHADLAAAEGVRSGLIQLAFTLLVALVIAIAMKVVGILLITSLLIIPAAAARRLARSPEQMALGAALIGALAVMAGLGGSLRWDTPAGPAIVVAAAGLFLATQLIGGLLRRPAA